MADVSTGLWSAVGAVLGGAAGAYTGYLAATTRPRARYSSGRRRGQQIEDAMVVGGAAGAVVGAFLGGTIAGVPKALPPTASK